MPNNVVWRYMFDIETDVISQWVGDSPKGERVDIQYPRGTVKTSPEKYYEYWWKPFEAGMNGVKDLWRKCGILKEGDSLSSAEEVHGAADAFRTMKEDDPKFAESVRDKRAEALKSLREGKPTPLQWYGFKGTVISGSNWATFRPDVVAELSGRMTFKSDDDDASLIDAIFTGVVDLCTTDPKDNDDDPRSDEGKKWTHGYVGIVPMLLSVTFDVGKSAQKWAPKRYQRQANGYWKYQRLTQGQFVAVANVKMEKKDGENQQITSATLSVFEIRPTPSKPWAGGGGAEMPGLGGAK